MTTHIEILAVADCPHAAVAVQRCRDASADLADVSITTTVVHDEDQAQRLGMRGSPTILINGDNRFDEPDTATSCSCRVGPDAVPSPDALRSWLKPVVQRLVGIYHASGTPWGELSYWLKARLGRTHCALCDITHGAVREKPEWQACRRELSVPFDTVHLDERDDLLAAFTEGRTPCVVAETSSGLYMVVDTAELAACDGAPACLVEAVERNADALGFELAESATQSSCGDPRRTGHEVF